MLAAACGPTTNAASAVFLTFGVLALIPILGIVPSVKPWLPSALVAAVVFLLAGTPARAFGRSAAAAPIDVGAKAAANNPGRQPVGLYVDALRMADLVQETLYPAHHCLEQSGQPVPAPSERFECR